MDKLQYAIYDIFRCLTCGFTTIWRTPACLVVRSCGKGRSYANWCLPRPTIPSPSRVPPTQSQASYSVYLCPNIDGAGPAWFCLQAWVNGLKGASCKDLFICFGACHDRCWLFRHPLLKAQICIHMQISFKKKRAHTHMCVIVYIYIHIYIFFFININTNTSAYWSHYVCVLRICTHACDYLCIFMSIIMFDVCIISLLCLCVCICLLSVCMCMSVWYVYVWVCILYYMYVHVCCMCECKWYGICIISIRL